MVIATAPCCCAAQSGRLYDRSVDADPTAPIWGWRRSGDIKPSADGAIDTLSERRHLSGWWLDLRREKFPTGGADITFKFDLAHEEHSSPNRSGFVLAFTDSAGRSVVVNLWDDEAWLSSDSPMFGHGEHARLRGGSTHVVEIEESHGLAGVVVDGSQIARVAMRDFSLVDSGLEGFLRPSTLFVGDATFGAGSQATLRSVSWSPRGPDTQSVAVVVSLSLGGIAATGLLAAWRRRRQRPRGSIYIERR